jgi:hypothetical protein
MKYVTTTPIIRKAPGSLASDVPGGCRGDRRATAAGVDPEIGNKRQDPAQGGAC